MKKIRLFNIPLTVLLLTALVVPATGCGAPSEEAASKKSNVATVQRGNLTTHITAAGNLAFSQTEDLIADLFYQQATIAEVNVETGDSVEECQVLVRIDADEWREEIEALENSLVAAERNVNTQERALTTAERLVTTRELAVAAARRQVSNREIACRTAEINLEAAEYALETIEEVAEVQKDIDNLEYQLLYIQSRIDILEPDVDFLNYQHWTDEKMRVEAKLAELQREIARILAGTSVNISDTTALEIRRKQLAIETARLNLESASDEVIQANLALIEAESSLEDAILDLEFKRADVEDAKKNIENKSISLEEARTKSPEIVAPFDGFIVSVNVKGGDKITKGTVLVQISAPDKFEAYILVSEAEILQVEVGTQATVVADAISGISFPATVTHISPKATISSGVVNYTIRVELQSFDELTNEHLARMEQFASDNFSGDFTPLEEFELPEGFELPEDFQMPDGFKRPEGFNPEGFEMPSNRFSQGVITDVIDMDFDLREGMSVTVSLIISAETDVLLVPYIAVTNTGGQSYVDVVLESGETEHRAVTTGSTNYAYIVITEGLTEGESILVPEGTIAAGSTSEFSFDGGFMIPRMGR